MRPLMPLTLVLLLCGCVNTTGGDLFTFSATAAGPADAVAGEPLVFDTPLGYHVTLTRARLHVGGVYLNAAVPSSGYFSPSCFLPGIYVAQLTRGLDLDVLSPEPQPFPEPGEATAGDAKTAEVWLTGAPIDAEDDRTVLVDVAGIAERNQMALPFEGQLTIGKNRVAPVKNPAEPGASPLCKQRIVSPISVELPLSRGGGLQMRVDPRGWFTNVDFALLPQVQQNPPLYRFLDTSEGQPSLNFYTGVRATAGVYAFEWRDSGP